MSDIERVTTALADLYHIERELGRGGMATVYLAEDRKHHRKMAVKVLRPDLAASLGPERFLREIEIAARLHHPHILGLYDSGEADGVLYYVMPYVEGESLRTRLTREKQLSVEDALAVTVEVADALGYAHSRDVVHRDIKPENIMLEGDHALVADFGIARAISAAGMQTITETGIAVGTPAYMSPEQSGGQRDIDGRSDIYSVACVLYEMLAGQPPFVGATVSSIVNQHLVAAPPNVSYMRPGVPSEIVFTVQEAMSKTPADRPPTARHFVEELTGLRPSRLSARMPVRRPRVRWKQLALVAGAVGAGALIATLAYRGGSPAALPPPARDWVVVADFQGSADAAHRAMGRSLVTTVLDQSQIVTALPDDQIRRGLDLAGRPDTTPVTVAVARELAVRGSINAVVTGQIDRAGNTYSVLLRVVEPAGGAIVTAVNGLASGDDRLIPVTDSLARALREGLGERADLIRSSRGLVEVATPSFEAYRKFVQAVELNADLDHDGARRLAREALALDPDFAAAYRLIGYTFFNVGRADSARAAFEQARARPARLTEQERLELEAFTAFVIDGDAERALGAYGRVIAVNPNVPLARTGRGNVLFLLGRYEEALGEFRTVVTISPFGPSQLNLSNVFATLLNLRRVEEADSVWRLMEGETRRDAEIELALAAEDWPRAAELAGRRYDDPATPAHMAMPAGLWLASALSAWGDVSGADSVLRDARERALRAGSRSGAVTLAQTRWLLAVAAGGEGEDVIGGFESDDSADAVLAEAARHFLAGRQDSVIGLLGGRAAAGVRDGVPGTLLDRWLVAAAYEAGGRLDSAAYYFELVANPARIDWLDRFRHGVTSAFAHRRLVTIYEALNRPADAARHRQAGSLGEDR